MATYRKSCKGNVLKRMIGFLRVDIPLNIVWTRIDNFFAIIVKIFLNSAIIYFYCLQLKKLKIEPKLLIEGRLMNLTQSVSLVLNWRTSC